MRSMSIRIILLLLFFSCLVTAAKFSDCLDKFKNDTSVANTAQSGGVNSQGVGVIPAQAAGLTYEVCRGRCTSGFGSFDWRDFTQLFASWLLPWLALLSQLPFGSGNYLDDLISVIMSVGSPALAAYSLALTSITARMACRRAKRITHESKVAVARALISLQQTSLKLTEDARLLHFIPINDQWRREIVERLGERNHWTIATATAVIWVIIAFGLTLINSFVSVDGTVDIVTQGHAVSILWLWLLCLVTGWLWVPTYTCGDLTSAVGHSNRKAVKKAAKALRQTAHKAKTRMRAVGGSKRHASNLAPEDPEVRNSAKTDITNILEQMPTLEGSKEHVVHSVPEDPEVHSSVEIEIINTLEQMPTLEGSVKPVVYSVSEVLEEGEVKGESIHGEYHKYAGQETEPNTSLLPDPAHHQSTVPSHLSPESQQGHGQLSVGANLAVNQSTTSMGHFTGGPSVAQHSIHPETHRFFTPKDPGWVNKDEFRLSATFNYSRIMGYLVLVDDVLRALEKPTREEDEKRYIPEVTATQHTQHVFPPGSFSSIFIAAFFALVLQCGTTAAATILAVFTPTFGLGCTSLGYITYGGVAIVIMFLSIISTIFARISETRKGRFSIVKGFTAFIAIVLRWISLILALANAVGLILFSSLQISHVIDNCYCNASVIGRGTGSFVTFSYDGWSTRMRVARAGATGVALISMAVYMTFLWLMSRLPKELDYS